MLPLDHEVVVGHFGLLSTAPSRTPRPMRIMLNVLMSDDIRRQFPNGSGTTVPQMHTLSIGTLLFS